MGWLDIVLLVIIVVAGIVGVRLGLIRAAFIVVGLLIGWLVAGQFSDDIGAAVGGSTFSDTLVTTVSYAVIVAASALVSAYAVKIARPMLSVLTMGLSGLVDRLGGLVLGLLLGIAVAGAIVIAGARLTYDFDSSTLTDRVPGQAADRLPEVDGVRDSLETALVASNLAGIVVDVADALPAGALGLAPSDFEVALDLLRDQIE